MSRQVWLAFFFLLFLLCAGFFLGNFLASARGEAWANYFAAEKRPYLAFLLSSEHKKLAMQPAGDELQENKEKKEKYGKAQGLLLPSTVGKFGMDKMISGEDALSLTQHIHGSDLPIKRVFIPYYSYRDKQVIIWVIQFNCLTAATDHMERIISHLEESQTSFDRNTSFVLENVDIYHFQESGSHNYLYRKENSIYWAYLLYVDPVPVFLQFFEHY